jgi:hypothetical protein
MSYISFNFSISFVIALEDNISEGFGGILPDVNISKF